MAVRPKSENTDPKEALLDAAVSVFSKKGFDGATVKDIADEASMNISAISYYFSGKEKLYTACLERMGMTRVQISESILTTPESVEDFRVKLKLFLGQIIEAHFQEFEVGCIVFRDLDLGRPETIEVFKRVFMKVFHHFETFIKDAQKLKIISPSLDPGLTTKMLWAPLLHFLRGDHINQMLHGKSLKDLAYRKDWIDHYLSIHLKGILRN